MRKLLLSATLLLAVAFTSPLSAQQGAVVSADEIDAVLEAHGRSTDADRAVVTRVLFRSDVESAARDAGFGDRLEEARASVVALDGDRLSRAASYAHSIETQLAGGQTITFSTITIILILLLVIIVILVAD